MATKIRLQRHGRKGYDQKQRQKRNHQKHIPGKMNPVHRHHADDNGKGDHHLKSIHAHPGIGQDIFGNIYFSNQSSIISY